MTRSFKYIIAIFCIALVSCKSARYADLEDGLYADMVTNKGPILLKLNYDLTPITVANFVSLAEGDNDYVKGDLLGKPYYDGIKFHRVIPDFMIQGGDPTGTGSGSPGYKFKDEFPKNEDGELIFKHDKAGILSMANSGPTTNGSQFFITHKETPWLDGKHTVFGEVVVGQNVVDSIVQNDYIEEIEIVKVGRMAKRFDAADVWNTYYGKLQYTIAETVKWFEAKKEEAIELPSGVKYAIVQTKNGEQPREGADVLVHYSGYFPDGKLFGTSFIETAKAYDIYSEKNEKNGAYEPFASVYGPQARLIQGFREGLQQLKIGDRALLFIPSHLGYGPQGAGKTIPPNADLVFEIELVDYAKVD